MKKIYFVLFFWFLFQSTTAPGLAQSCCPDSDSISSVFAGTGIGGYTGDGGLATSAQLGVAYDVKGDAAGNIYISDGGYAVIRKVNPAGIISTYAGTGANGFSGDGGSAASAQLSFPTYLAIDSAGDLFVSDSGNNRIREITSAGIINTVAGNGTAGFSGDGGQATSAALDFPFGVAVDAAGNIYVADDSNYRIRKITPGGVISTITGNGTQGYSGDGGLASAAKVGQVESVITDAAGDVIFNDDTNARVRMITPAGIITTIAGNGINGGGGNGGPATLANVGDVQSLGICGGNLYLGDVNGVRMINSCGIINAVVGNTYWPNGMYIDGLGNMYFTTGQEVIKLAPDCSPTPTPACVITPTYTPTSTPTDTSTVTPVFTYTNTPTPTSTFTASFSPTYSNTPIVTSTPTITFTPTNTPTATLTSVDIFTANKNLFKPAVDKNLTITVQSDEFPGYYSLRIYNTAGEHIKDLDARYLSSPVSQTYLWDGTNLNGDACASGMYIIYLVEPINRKVKRVLLVR